jgi:hypothetical protein
MERGFPVDPDATLVAFRIAVLAWQQAIVGDSIDGECQAASEAIEAAVALDDWLSRGGFAPVAWQVNRS